jgi:hypothetical protein
MTITRCPPAPMYLPIGVLHILCKWIRMRAHILGPVFSKSYNTSASETDQSSPVYSSISRMASCRYAATLLLAIGVILISASFVHYRHNSELTEAVGLGGGGQSPLNRGESRYQRVSIYSELPTCHLTKLPCTNLLWLTMSVLMFIGYCTHFIVHYSHIFGATQYVILSVSIIICILFTFIILHLYKYYELKLFTRNQRRRKLNFDTKLGMNSPY